MNALPSSETPRSLSLSAAPFWSHSDCSVIEASLECVGTGWRSGFLQTSPFTIPYSLHCHLCPGLASMASSLVPSWKACALWSWLLNLVPSLQLAGLTGLSRPGPRSEEQGAGQAPLTKAHSSHMSTHTGLLSRYCAHIELSIREALYVYHLS